MSRRNSDRLIFVGARPSFFRRAGRYKGGENGLTEAFAAVIEEVPGVARGLALAWLNPKPESSFLNESAAKTEGVFNSLSLLSEFTVRVRTQLRLRPPGDATDRVADLCLEFQEEGKVPLIVVVEIKHYGFHPHDRQLTAYQSALDKSHPSGSSAVVLLAPKNEIPKYEATELEPRTIPVRAWEKVPDILRYHATRSETEAWLVKEFLKYMREEKLMLPEALGPEHMIALARYEDARDALFELVRIAREEVSATPRYVGFETNERDPVDECYSKWDLPSGAPYTGEAWLEFKVSRTVPDPGSNVSSSVNPHGEEILFLAGLSCSKGNEMFGNSDAASSRDRLLSEGFHIFDDRFCNRFMRVATPSSVLCGSDLTEQGQSLGAWVTESFSAVLD